LVCRIIKNLCIHHVFILYLGTFLSVEYKAGFVIYLCIRCCLLSSSIC